MRLRPGLLTRLNHLMILQVLFVFGALALVIFYPQSQLQGDPDFATLKEKHRQLAERVTQTAGLHAASPKGLLADDSLRQRTARVFGSVPDIRYARLFVRNHDGEVTPLLSYSDSTMERKAAGFSEEFSLAVDDGLIAFEMDLKEGVLVPWWHGSHHRAYYYRFELLPRTPAVLVTVTDHGLFISDRSRLKYALLLLFLVSTLLSLLTVSLMSSQLKVPLKRLIYGLEKTAQGEHYHLIETEGDEGLRRLQLAFNSMSRTLWEDKQEIGRFIERLRNTNWLLLQSQRFLGALIDGTPAGVVTTDADGRIVLFNRKASELFGHRPEDAIGRHFDLLFSAPVTALLRSEVSAMSQDSREVLCRRLDGSIFPAYLIVSPVPLEGSDTPAWLLIIKDISESKSFQEMMIRIDRYYTRGQMVGDIAHEINNHLAILSGNIELIPLLLQKQDNEKVTRKLELMRKVVERITRFADGLLDCDQDELKFEKADLNQLVENLLAFLRPQNRFDRVTIEADLSTKLPLVALDASQVQQVLINLIQNAADSVKKQSEKGHILVRTSLTRQETGAYARVEVQDNGPGVSPERRSLLFDKRFTTKRRGSGLGLVSCRKIVKAHGGTIGFRQSDRATIFYLELPIQQGSADRTPTRTDRGEPAARLG